MKMKTKTAMLANGILKNYRVIFMLLIFGGAIFAATIADTGSQISDLICGIYDMINGLVPIIAFTLIVLAGVAYGLGNFFGAETRSKAAGWGMSALTGAIIMLVIYIIGPVIINALYTTGTDYDIETECGIT